MSLNFRILKHVRGSELFDGRLESHGVFEGVPIEDSTKGARCLYDEGGVLWAYMDENDKLDCLTVYGAHAPIRALVAIQTVFEAKIVSENEPQYYGYETEEELHEWMEKCSRGYREKEANEFVEIVKYLKGEPNGVAPGTVQMEEAEVGKMLLAQHPSLLVDEQKLHSAINEAIRERIQADSDLPFRRERVGSGTTYGPRIVE